MSPLRRLGVLAVCAVFFVACGSDDQSIDRGTLTLEESQAIADEIVRSFDASDFTPVEELLGEDGRYVSVTGVEYDRDTVSEFLSSFESVASVSRSDEYVEAADGYAIKMSETRTSGSSVSFWIFVSRAKDGALTITEGASPPSS